MFPSEIIYFPDSLSSNAKIYYVGYSANGNPVRFVLTEDHRHIVLISLWVKKELFYE